MTHLNIRMVLGWKSEPVTAWSPVSLTSNRVDTHTYINTRTCAHAHTICETHIADTIVPESRVLGQINFV